MSAIQLAALNSYTLLKYKYLENNFNATQALLRNANTVSPTYFGVNPFAANISKQDTALMIKAQSNAFLYQAAAAQEEELKARLSRENELKRNAIANGFSIFA